MKKRELRGLIMEVNESSVLVWTPDGDMETVKKRPDQTYKIGEEIAFSKHSRINWGRVAVYSSGAAAAALLLFSSTALLGGLSEQKGSYVAKTGPKPKAAYVQKTEPVNELKQVETKEPSVSTQSISKDTETPKENKLKEKPYLAKFKQPNAVRPNYKVNRGSDTPSTAKEQENRNEQMEERKEQNLQNEQQYSLRERQQQNYKEPQPQDYREQQVQDRAVTLNPEKKQIELSLGVINVNISLLR